MRKLPRWAKWAAIAVVVLTVVLLVSWGLGGNKDGGDAVKQPQEQGSSEETSTPTSTTKVSDSGWVAATLADGSLVYGQIADSGAEGFVGIKNAYFVAQVVEGESGENVLRRYGGEAHAPEPYLVIPETSMLYREPLSDESQALAAIESNENAQPSGVKSIEFGEDRMSAVFLTNGEVYFGKLSVEGSNLVLEGAHFLRFVDEDAAELGTIESLDQVQLVPRSATPSRPTGDLYIPGFSVLYTQTLNADSPVIEALSAAK